MDLRNNQPFRFWCQKVLPLVYEDSLSYYEVLCKVVAYLNSMRTDMQNLINEVDAVDGKINEHLTEWENRYNALESAFNQLQQYVNNYFDSVDMQTEINNKLDEMAESGQLSDIIANFAGMLTLNTNTVLAKNQWFANLPNVTLTSGWSKNGNNYVHQEGGELVLPFSWSISSGRGVPWIMVLMVNAVSDYIDYIELSTGDIVKYPSQPVNTYFYYALMKVTELPVTVNGVIHFKNELEGTAFTVKDIRIAYSYETTTGYPYVPYNTQIGVEPINVNNNHNVKIGNNVGSVFSGAGYNVLIGNKILDTAITANDNIIIGDNVDLGEATHDNIIIGTFPNGWFHPEHNGIIAIGKYFNYYKGQFRFGVHSTDLHDTSTGDYTFDWIDSYIEHSEWDNKDYVIKTPVFNVICDTDPQVLNSYWNGWAIRGVDYSDMKNGLTWAQSQYASMRFLVHKDDTGLVDSGAIDFYVKTGTTDGMKRKVLIENEHIVLGNDNRNYKELSNAIVTISDQTIDTSPLCIAPKTNIHSNPHCFDYDGTNLYFTNGTGKRFKLTVTEG